MMRLLSKFLSYLLHPLFTPTYGTVFYFLLTPKYSPLEMQAGNILPVFILTVIIPLGSLLILKHLGMMRSPLLLSSEERIYPLLIYLVLLLMVLLKVIPNHYSEELYYFFLSLSLATTSCLLLAITGDGFPPVFKTPWACRGAYGLACWGGLPVDPGSILVVVRP